MNWFKKKKPKYKPRIKTMYDFFRWFYVAEREVMAMGSFIQENSDCGDMNKIASDKIRHRYNLREIPILGLAWYLLEQYFKGNITIKEENELD